MDFAATVKVDARATAAGTAGGSIRQTAGARPIAELSVQPVLELPHLAIISMAVVRNSGVQVLQLFLEQGGDQTSLQSSTGHGGQAVELAADSLTQRT